MRVVAVLFALPAGAVFGVFEEDAEGFEFFADGVSAGEVAGLFGVGAFGDEGFDLLAGEGEGGYEVGGGFVHAAFALCPSEGGAGEVGVAVLEDGEDGVEAGEDFEDGSGVLRAQESGVRGGVSGADEIEDGGAGLCGVEVIGEGGVVPGEGLGGCGGEVCVAALREGGLHAGGEGAEAFDGVGGLCEAFEGEVELVAVGDAHEKKANGGGTIALEEKVAEGVEVALGLGHFAAFNKQEAHVHPVAGEGGAGGGFRLGDLVFVVRKHEVFAACVEVEVGAEVFCGHGGALDVPAGASGAEGGLPRVFASAVGGSFDGLPEGEVTGGFLVVINLDACSVLDAFEVFFRELAVGGEAGDAEVPASVLRLVSAVAGAELLDERDHFRDVVSGVRDDFGALDAEGGHVLEEGVLEAFAVGADIESEGGGVADDLVVDVRDVHDVADGDPMLPEGATEDVDVEEGAEVADVAEVVDGGAAGVHTQFAAIGGSEGFDLPAEGVEELQFQMHAPVRMLLPDG